MRVSSDIPFGPVPENVLNRVAGRAVVLCGKIDRAGSFAPTPLARVSDGVGQSPGRRFVHFVVMSDHVSGPELGQRLGVQGDRVRTRRESAQTGQLSAVSRVNVWELGSLLGPTTVVEAHLASSTRK